eukprot:1981759-Prymnesium_polylepis.1
MSSLHDPCAARRLSLSVHPRLDSVACGAAQRQSGDGSSHTSHTQITHTKSHTHKHNTTHARVWEGLPGVPIRAPN